MRITKDHAIYAMDKNNPSVATIKTGEKVVFETCDCFHDTVLTEDDRVSEIDFSKVNPATGPLYVEGAEAGDVLKVDIKRITLFDQGAVVTAPGLGRLASEIIEEETVICQVEEDHITYKGRRIPLQKMIGVIGTAPAGEGIITGTPDAHGGNMDTTMVKEGVSVYLPVNVKGALLGIGDLHACMGDGEIMGSGLEVRGEVEVQVDVIKDLPYKLPMIETESLWVTLGSAPTGEEAADIAIKNMVDLIMAKTDLTFNQAGMLLSLAGNLRVSQLVNPHKTMRMELAKEYF